MPNEVVEQTSKEYKVWRRFSTTVMVDGRNVYLSYQRDEVVTVENAVFDLVENELPGYLRPVRPDKPRDKDGKTVVKSQPKVETKAGASDKAKTRQVTKTNKPKGKK